MKISGIYKIESKIKPERCYIGSAVNIDTRWRGHLSQLRKNKHNKKLQRHYNKYGESDLQFSILLGCDISDLIKTEQYFLDSYKPFFNICKKADSPLGIKHLNRKRLSKDDCKKMSDKKKGSIPWNKGIKTGIIPKNAFKKGHNTWNKNMKMSEEFCQKNRDIHIGKKQSEETKQKRNTKLRGKIRSDQTRLNMSESKMGNKNPMYGKKASPDTCKKMSDSHKLRWAEINKN